MKTCTSCKQEKDNQFFRLRSDTGKRRSICKTCRTLAEKKRRDKKEKSEYYLGILENRELRTQGKKRCKTCGEVKCLRKEFSKNTHWCKDCFKAWYQKNKQVILEQNRANYYKRTYGTTREELGKCCEICGREENLAIDHCHDSGKVRGLLCRQCNSAIGLLQDDPLLLEAARRYVCNSK